MRKLEQFSSVALLFATLLLVTGCDDNDYEKATYFTLQMLHAADMDGVAGALDNVENFSGLVREFEDDYENTLILSSGDNYIPGPRFSAADDDSMTTVPGIIEPGQGRGDIAFLNAMGFQVSAVGNHDLDTGTEGFADIIAADGNYPGAQFPYLSANLDFSTDANLAPLVLADGQSAENMANGLASSATIELPGTDESGPQIIGIVGASTPKLASITSTDDITVLPANSDDIPALATTIQAEVDALTATGIDKVILLAHMQIISVEQQLARLLRDVDIIVAGGSNTLLADGTDALRLGDVAAETYPLEFDSASGEPVLVVNTDGDYKYLGRLVVSFDENGVIELDSLDPEINGAYATDDANTAAVGADDDINPEVTAVANALRDVIVARDSVIVGNTAVFLDGRRSQVRSQETNLGNLTADANLWVARQFEPGVQASIKNGGGIRAEIGIVTYPPGATGSEDELLFLPPQPNDEAEKEEGDISQFAIETTLRFNNGLTLLTITAEDMKNVLENAVSQVEETSGRFAQVAGMRFSFDPTLAPRQTDGDEVTSLGQRIRSAALVDDSGNITDVLVQNGEVMGDPARPIRIVTLGFLADGGDEYPYPVEGTGRVNLPDAGLTPGSATFADPGTEQDALAEYLWANFPDSSQAYTAAETEASLDERIQNVSERADTVLP